jgi:uncharacterized protein YjiS (DUF1127 family)
MGRWVADAWAGWLADRAAARAEAELRALDDRALHDLALDRGGLREAALHGRERG